MRTATLLRAEEESPPQPPLLLSPGRTEEGGGGANTAEPRRCLAPCTADHYFTRTGELLPLRFVRRRERKAFLTSPLPTPTSSGPHKVATLLCCASLGRQGKKERRSTPEAGKAHRLTPHAAVDKEEGEPLRYYVRRRNHRHTRRSCCRPAERKRVAEVPTPPNHAAASHHAPPIITSPEPENYCRCVSFAGVRERLSSRHHCQHPRALVRIKSLPCSVVHRWVDRGRRSPMPVEISHYSLDDYTPPCMLP
nr:hypothetical protein Iba_chr03aCG7670 [Ipomoea batatas]